MKEGWYWCNWNEWWQIGLYRDGVFTFSASESDVCISEIDEIGEYIEMPDKYRGNK